MTPQRDFIANSTKQFYFLVGKKKNLYIKMPQGFSHQYK